LIYNEDEPDTPETEETDEAGEPREQKLRYDTVPYDVVPEEDLYAFRDALSTPEQSPQRAQVVVNAAGNQVAQPVAPAQKKKQQMLLALVTIGCVVLAIIAVVTLQQGTPPPPYVDLGSSHVANSGLSGDLIARWTGKANYVFYVNPMSSDNLTGFAAVAAAPPRQIVFNIHLKDASGVTVCDKEIVFPFRAQENGSTIPTQGPPEKTMDGDAISYERGSQGEIVRIEVNGPMNCAEKLYDRIAIWDFTTTYPVKGDQDDWVNNLEKGSDKTKTNKKKSSPAPLVRSLPAAIDGDDVIVGDNPSHGTVLTRAGHEFYVGPGGLSSHGEGWGLFPAAIHYHCDVKSNCTLTRSGATSTVFARLMK
jgi:hypothetical protein